MGRNDILENLKTSLEAIDGTGSWTNTLAFVSRGFRADVGEDQYPHVMILNPQEEVKIQEFNKAYLAEVNVLILAVCKDKTAAQLEVFIEEILKALVLDPSRGNYANSTTIERHELHDIDKSENQWIGVEIIIKFRRELT